MKILQKIVAVTSVVLATCGVSYGKHSSEALPEDTLKKVSGFLDPEKFQIPKSEWMKSMLKLIKTGNRRASLIALDPLEKKPIYGPQLSSIRGLGRLIQSGNINLILKIRNKYENVIKGNRVNKSRKRDIQIQLNMINQYLKKNGIRDHIKMPKPSQQGVAPEGKSGQRDPRGR